MSDVIRLYLSECSKRKVEPFYGFLEFVHDGRIDTDIDFCSVPALRLFIHALGAAQVRDASGSNPTGTSNDISLRCLSLRLGSNRHMLHPPVKSNELKPFATLSARFTPNSCNFLLSDSSTASTRGISSGPQLHLVVRFLTGVASTLRRHAMTLQTLRLSGITLSVDKNEGPARTSAPVAMPSLGFSRLSQALMYCRHLSVLDLSDSHLGDIAAASVLAAACELPLLSELHLSGCRLTDSGATEVLSMLISRSQAKHSEVNFQKSLRQVAPKKHADGMGSVRHQSGSGITVLNLSRNVLGDRFCSRLASLLQHDESLQSLRLDQNAITTNGASTLLRAVEQSLSVSPLTFLDLSNNGGITVDALLPQLDALHRAACQICIEHSAQLLLTRALTPDGLPFTPGSTQPATANAQQTKARRAQQRVNSNEKVGVSPTKPPPLSPGAARSPSPLALEPPKSSESPSIMADQTSTDVPPPNVSAPQPVTHSTPPIMQPYPHPYSFHAYHACNGLPSSGAGPSPSTWEAHTAPFPSPPNPFGAPCYGGHPYGGMFPLMMFAAVPPLCGQQFPPYHPGFGPTAPLTAVQPTQAAVTQPTAAMHQMRKDEATGTPPAETLGNPVEDLDEPIPLDRLLGEQLLTMDDEHDEHEALVKESDDPNLPSPSLVREQQFTALCRTVFAEESARLYTAMQELLEQSELTQDAAQEALRSDIMSVKQKLEVLAENLAVEIQAVKDTAAELDHDRRTQQQREIEWEEWTQRHPEEEMERDVVTLIRAGIDRIRSEFFPPPPSSDRANDKIAKIGVNVAAPIGSGQSKPWSPAVSASTAAFASKELPSTAVQQGTGDKGNPASSTRFLSDVKSTLGRLGW